MEKIIKYKAIFINEHSKEVVEYKERGNYSIGIFNIISFNNIKIKYNNKQIYLYNNDSCLYLKKDEDIVNYYKTDIGNIRLITKLVNIIIKPNYLAFKYELYDDNGLILKTYITVNIT